MQLMKIEPGFISRQSGIGKICWRKIISPNSVFSRLPACGSAGKSCRRRGDLGSCLGLNPWRRLYPLHYSVHSESMDWNHTEQLSLQSLASRVYPNFFSEHSLGAYYIVSSILDRFHHHFNFNHSLFFFSISNTCIRNRLELTNKPSLSFLLLPPRNLKTG